MTTLLIAYTIFLLLMKSASCGGVIVTISDPQKKNDKDAEVLYKRLHSKDIVLHGSHMQGIALHVTSPYEDDHWSISGELVYGLPNEGSAAPLGLINGHEVLGKVVLLHRTEDDDVPVFEQMLIAQHFGAVAVIIADHPYKNLKRSALDVTLNAYHSHRDSWHTINIPAVIVAYEGVERMKRSMDLVKGDLPGFADQNVMADSMFADIIRIDGKEHHRVQQPHDEL